VPYVKSEGFDIFYETCGSGDPLLLHHGTMCSGRSWEIDGYVASLQECYQVIQLDARGHGRSSKPRDPSNYSDDCQVADILAVLDDLGLNKVRFWGYSWGARVGYALASLAPERCRCLVLGGGSPFERKRRSAIKHSKDPVQAQKNILNFFGLTVHTIPNDHRDVFLSNDFLAIQALFKDMPSLKTELTNLNIPMFLYAGTEDPACIDNHMISEVLSNCIVEDLEGLNHLESMMSANLILPRILPLLEGA